MDGRNPLRDKKRDDVALLMEGVDHWNEKRPVTPDFCGEDIPVRFARAGKLDGNTAELPSLAGANFSNGRYVGTQFESMFAGEGLDLRSADFRWADLREAALGDAVLDGANFVGAKLDAADLSGAGLRGADLGAATIRRADLSGADLCGGSFTGADLRDANLSGARLADTDLSSALLAGASLYGSRPWLSRLFAADPDGAHRVEAVDGQIEITSIGEMIEHCSRMVAVDAEAKVSPMAPSVNAPFSSR